jgi:hypothetical protein
MYGTDAKNLTYIYDTGGNIQQIVSEFQGSTRTDTFVMTVDGTVASSSSVII